MNQTGTADLTPEQQELLELLLQKEGVEGAGSPILKRSGSGPAPLSFTQERVWFLHQLLSEVPFDNLPMAFRVRGSLDPHVLEQSFNEIVRRHEILRTVCGMEGGRPVQRIQPAVDASLPVTDLRSLPEEEREKEALRLVEQIVRRPIRLSDEFPFRTALWRTGEQEWVLLILLHQFGSDGWSARLLLRELSSLYRAYALGENPALDEPPVQYADFSAWQQRWMNKDALTDQLAYWKKQLAGAPVRVDLPVRSREKTTSVAGATHSFQLSRSLSDRLRELSRKHATTLFSTLLASFQALLHRYTSQADVVVGTAISTRNCSEIEQILGSFSNFLLLRTNFAGDPTFVELLDRVRGVAVDAFAHQDLPLEHLIEETRNEPGRYPLMQVFFLLRDDTPSENLEIPGLRFEDLSVHMGTTTLDLSLDMTDTEDALSGSLTYKTDLFDGETIARIAADLETVLGWAVEDPQRRLSTLPVVRPEVHVDRDAASRHSEYEAVEYALTEHEFIEAAAVGTSKDELGDERLTAYVVFAEGEELTATEVRRFLRQQLPGVTPPALIVEVDQLPESSGVDAHALPGVDQGAPRANATPSSEVEKQIAGIWREALGIDGPSLHDTFFDLGGHSLLAMRVLARIQSETGCYIEPQAIVRDTLGQIAARVQAATRTNGTH